ncbi:MAG: hypothetical protein RLZZ225_457 [Pseudomonadota bacterium]|jgi:hypothetical protein
MSIENISTDNQPKSFRNRVFSVKQKEYRNSLTPWARGRASSLRLPSKRSETNIFGSEPIVLVSPISEQDKEFQVMVSKVYNAKELTVLNHYLDNLAIKSPALQAPFFLKNLAQLAENKPHLAEWACTYLISSDKLSVTVENILSYPFIARVLSRIKAWSQQALLAKYASVCEQAAVYDPLFRNWMVSFLYKLRSNEIKIFTPKAKKPGVEIDQGNEKRVGDVDYITISVNNPAGFKILVIFDPINITQEESSSPYYLSNLIESFVSKNNKAKPQATVSASKALFLFNEGKNIAFIEIVTSKSAKKIVIHNVNLILKPELIREVKHIAKHHQYVFSISSDTSRLGNYDDIKNSINQFLLGTTLEISRSASPNTEKDFLDEIKNNLDLSDQYNDSDLLALFKQAIPWNLNEFNSWKKNFLSTTKETPCVDKTSINIAKQVSAWMLATPSLMKDVLEKDVSTLDVNLILLNFYFKLLDKTKAELSAKSAPNKGILSKFFSIKNNPKAPDSFSKIHCFLLFNRFAEITDLHSLFPKQAAAESFRKQYTSYETIYHACVELISSSEALSLRKPFNRGSH